MRLVAGLGLTIAACSYTPAELPAEDARGDGPAPSDTADAPPDSFVGPPPSPCVEKWLAGTPAFASTVVVPSVGNTLFTTAEERDPSLSSDELTLFFTRPGNGGDEDVLISTRTSLNLPFSAPTTFNSLSDNNQVDGKVTLSGDDLTAIVASLRSGGEGDADLWIANRASGGATPFGTLAQSFLENVNDSGRQLDPHLSPDGRRLYLAAGSSQKLVVASRDGALVSFGTPTEIPVIGDPAGDADPTLTADERVIVFTSNRAGGAGGTDLWYATRAERDQPFSAPIALAALNSNENDGDPFISPDGCRVYFASTQTAGGNDFDLLVAALQ